MSSTAKVVLITGCSQGGIGFALSEAFAGHGCKVYATARRIEAMEGLAKHPSVERVKLDVTSDEEVQAVVQTVLEKEGRIDILVNNAGYTFINPLIDVPMKDIQQSFDTNVFAPIRLAKAVIPHMAARRSGTIINMGSIAETIPTPFGGVYSATKASLEMISEVLEMECAPFNIRIMHLAPGGIKSNIAANAAARHSLPESSLYKGWLDAILKRLFLSQAPGALDTNAFAERVVAAALRRSPPRRMSLGSNVLLFAFFRWLPRSWVLRIMWAVIAGKPKPVS